MKKEKINRKWISCASAAAGLVLAGAGAALAAGGGGHGEVHNVWITEDTWKVLNFGILFAACFIIGKKFVPSLLRSRAQGIADEIQELESKKADAEKKLAEYQAKFKNLDQESKQIVEDYIKQGEEAKARILAEAKSQADKLEETAKRNIAQEFKSAKSVLQQEIVELAMDKAEEVVKASIKPADQNKLVDEYLKKVVA